MGLIDATIHLINPGRPSLRAGLGKAGAVFVSEADAICLREHVALQLNLSELKKRDVPTTERRSALMQNAGTPGIRFENRNRFTDALVSSNSVLMAAVPPEDMDLAAHPDLHLIEVNRARPTVPSAVVESMALPDIPNT